MAIYDGKGGMLETLTVYVLNKAEGDEGESTIGVFGLESSAISHIQAEHAKRWDQPLKRFEDVYGCSYWADEERSCWQWYIRPFEVR